MAWCRLGNKPLYKTSPQEVTQRQGEMSKHADVVTKWPTFLGPQIDMHFVVWKSLWIDCCVCVCVCMCVGFKFYRKFSTTVKLSKWRYRFRSWLWTKCLFSGEIPVSIELHRKLDWESKVPKLANVIFSGFESEWWPRKYISGLVIFGAP